MNIPGRCRLRRDGVGYLVAAIFFLSFIHSLVMFISNLTVIHSDYNCLYSISPFVSDVYVETAINLPLTGQMAFLSREEVTCLYHRYVATLQDHCSEPKRFGEVDSGGIHFCVDEEYLSKNGCAVVNFDPRVTALAGEQINSKYNCSIYYFEKWRFRSSNHINYVHSHVTAPGTFYWLMNLQIKEGKSLDMLILPVKSSDEGLVKHMMRNQMFSWTSQVTLNLYLNSHLATSTDYKRMLVILRLFYDAGFRIFWFDRPWECAPLFGKLNHCYNVFLKRPSTFSVEKLGNIKSHPVPSPKSPRNYITLKHLEVYYRYITIHQYLCKQIVRFGNIKDGGWEVCHDVNFRPARRKCLVYSFGINNEWSFDDDVTQTYECELHAFDPSMRIQSQRRSKFIYFHNLGLSDKKETKAIFGNVWQLSDLKSIISELGHVNRTIDILKLDIESFEKKALPQMLESGVLDNVVQLSIEFHNFRNLTTLQKLYTAGFRMFWSHQNHYSKYSFNNDSVAKAMEVYYVNINKMKKYIDE